MVMKMHVMMMAIIMMVTREVRTARARRTRSDLVCDNDDVLIVDYDDDVNQGGETNPRRNM